MTTDGRPEPWSDADFRPIASALRARRMTLPEGAGVTLVQSRLRARLEDRGFGSFTQFFEREVRPRPDGPGMQMVVDLSTINHSGFFREPESLRRVAEDLAGRLRTAPVRAWCAGCSAGQEPYSLVMAVAEMVPILSLERLEVIASDLSLEMLRSAASATYEERELDGVSPDRLRRFFLRGRDRRRGEFKVAPEIRRPVRFLHFDLRDADWPVVGGLDAALCRNVLIYFDEDARRPLVERLAERVRGGGTLALGLGEIIPGQSATLRRLQASVYRKVATP